MLQFGGVSTCLFRQIISLCIQNSKNCAFPVKFVTLYHIYKGMHDFLMFQLYFRCTFAAETIRNI